VHSAVYSERPAPVATKYSYRGQSSSFRVAHTAPFKMMKLVSKSDF
jgi:hypothetical protein